MAKLICTGNIKLLLCFTFYLVWWIVAFNPIRPIRGLLSAWLLVPAFVLGILALTDIVHGVDYVAGPIPAGAIVGGGVACYLILLGVTYGLLHRPVTSELFIIVLWAIVAALELNTLVALGSVAPMTGAILAVISLICIGASIVCYQSFYELEGTAAFVDGTIPLVLAAIMTGVIAFCSG